MSKNPYKLIEKSNKAFNLFLSSFNDYENFIESSNKNDSDILYIINSILKLTIDNQNQIKNLDNRISAISENIKVNENLIQDIDSNISLLNEKTDLHFTDFVNNIDNSTNNINNQIKLSKESIEDSIKFFNISSNNKLTGTFSDMENFLKYNFDDVVGLINQNNSEFGDKFDDVVGLINQNNDNLNNHCSAISEKLIHLSESNNHISNSLDLINNHYKNARLSFFKGYEDNLKNFLDTDFLFNFCYFNNIEFLSYSPEENLLLFKTKEGIIIGSNNHVWTIREIYGLNEYIIPILYNLEDFVVFDIGMNRAYASLRFANFDNCSAVYGFEIDNYTYSKALDNISYNPQYINKIHTYNFGLSDKDGIVNLYYLDGFDGLNTMIPDFLNQGSALNDFQDKVCVKKVNVKRASDVLSNIIQSDKITSNIVLKIDTEGAEYKIIRDIIDSGLIDKIDIIVGEGHIFSNKDFKRDLLSSGFKIIKFDVVKSTYDFAFVKEKFFNFWPLLEV